jgi:hypothetical protein
MRIRAAIAMIVLLLPAEVSAQRLRVPGARRPTPTDLPPQAPGIAREMAYKRLPFSVETYPLISRIESSGFIGDGVASSWTSAGAGTRLAYRIAPNLAATMDLTSSFVGGPLVMETAEIGTRLRPDRSEGRFYPFVDVRFGYAYAYHTYFRPMADPFGSINTQPALYGSRYSQGFGAVAGAGAEYALTRRFSVTAGASAMRNRMRAYGYEGVQPSSTGYRMTVYRYTAGIRYNPVRLTTPSSAR